MTDWSLTNLQLKLIKIGARVERHARAIAFQLAEVTVTGAMVRAILAAIHRLRAPPSCACPRYEPKLHESGKIHASVALKTGPPRSHSKELLLDLPNPGGSRTRSHRSRAKDA